MIRALFVCSQNRLRSPTAEHVFSQYEGVECESAGVHDSANVPIGVELIEWADIIFVMERAHRDKITKKFKRHLNGKRIVVLGIPDEYEYMDDALIELLERKVPPFLAMRPPRRAG
ncbi:low molecular weight protein tyrosine phosphatase family protein [Ideonella sp.]|uniref:low molecular weight protein tyrosine phosphatase family protein n=1 Tax=Ideonella sp. TaxID=1929293 RepID=UPI0035AEB8B5